MDISTFWNLIDETRRMSNGNMDNQIKLLLTQLLEFDADNIFSFQKIFTQMREKSYRAELWNAAAIIACGCSDDAFDDFCGWLIAQGKSTFENAISDPDTLASMVNIDIRDDAFDSRLIDVAPDAYQLKLGQEMPIIEYSQPLTLIGEFVPKENFSQKFPKLVAKFGDCL